MPSSRRTRERQLAKLAARRAAERRRKQRQKILAFVVAGLVAAAGLTVLSLALLRNKAKPTASASASPTASASASASASAAPVACGGTVPKAASVTKPSFSKAPATTIDATKTYTVSMTTSCGEVSIRFDPKLAPHTVNSLVFLIRKHFFDGLTFHRIARGFVIQGGDPKGDGTGGPGYSTVDKPPSGAKYPKGTVAMAKASSDPAGTAGSQFFIVTSDAAQSSLAPNGQPAYAIVGRVVSGLDVVDKIAALPITGGRSDGAPAQKVYIVRVTVKES